MMSSAPETAATTPALPARRHWHAWLVDSIVLLALWAGCALLVNPVGDFPLNDDWSFAQTVQALLQTGSFRPHEWASMPLLSNTLWGALFAGAFGFSFTSLRLSTLVLGYVGLLAVYAMLRGTQQPRPVALGVALALAFNPVTYALSHTFMTDLPFVVWLTLAALFLARHLRTQALGDLALGCVFAVIAMLSRQLALAVPLAFAGVLLLTQGLRVTVLWRALLPLALSGGALLGLEQWLSHSGRMPQMYTAKSEPLWRLLDQPLEALGPLFLHAVLSLTYVSLLALPALPWLLLRLKGRQRWAVTVLALAALAGLLGLVLGAPHAIPPIGNMLTKAGIGPQTLKDIYILRLDHLAPMPGLLLSVIARASVLAAALLTPLLLVLTGTALHRLWQQRRLRLSAVQADAQHDAAGLFLVTAGLLYLAPVLLLGVAQGIVTDRYLVPALPLLVPGLFALAGAAPVRKALIGWTAHSLTALWLLGTMIFSVAVTHDYLEWNRTRWQLLNWLTQERGVPWQQIDGGFEFNGLYGYDPHYQPQPGKSWWWVRDDRYLLTFSLVPGYVPLKATVYPQWLPWRQAPMFVLQRPGP